MNIYVCIAGFEGSNEVACVMEMTRDDPRHFAAILDARGTEADLHVDGDGVKTANLVRVHVFLLIRAATSGAAGGPI